MNEQNYIKENWNVLKHIPCYAVRKTLQAIPENNDLDSELLLLHYVLKYLDETKGAQLSENRSLHASHIAYQMLKDVNEEFNLEYPGIEGWSFDCGKKGVNYLNAGDPYVKTIFAYADFSTIEFKIATLEEVMNSNWFLPLE